MSTLEQTSADLKAARFVVHQLGETFDGLQVHSCSIFNLAEQWRNLQSSFNDVNNSLESRVKDLEAKAREIGVVTVNLENLRTEIELRRENLECGEKSLREEVARVELSRNEVRKLLEIVEVRKREVSEREKTVEVKEKELCEGLERVRKVDDEEVRVKKYELEINEWRRAVELEEIRVDSVGEEVGIREKEIDERCKAVELRESGVEERCTEVESKEREISELKEVLEERVNEGNRVMDLRERDLDEIYGLLELRESEIDEREKGVESREKVLNVRGEDVNLREGGIKVQCEELKAKEKEFGDRLKELLVVEELKEKMQLHNGNGNEEGGSIFSAMDGKTLQLYLNERAYKHEFMKAEIVEMLKSMPNPAKLVLDAIDGFFPLHLSKDDIVFEASIVRSSCLLLLEHLMNMKPRLATTLKKKATAVALEWQENMWVEGESEDGALAFLLLLVTYKLTTVVNKDELRRLCGIIDNHRLAPCLRQIFGLLQKTDGTDCIEDVIEEPSHSDSVQAANALDSLTMKNQGDIRSLCRTMNEHGVRSYLTHHVKEYSVLHDKILDALRNAPNLAKLVLNVCQISVTDSDQNHTDGTTCIFVLEQLMKLSPLISREVTKEAKKFASLLRAKLKRSWNSVDHYRFLQFLVSYKLANSYNPDELLSHFKVLYYGDEVYRPEENAYLCSALGLVKKIPGVIKSLINQQLLLSAAQYICVFKLERTFPPGPLLETHFQNAKKVADQKRTDGTFKDKIVAERLESMTLKSILTCISNFKLESRFPPDHFFLACLMELQKDKERRLYAKCVRKRNGRPRQLEKRPRVENVQQSEPISPVYLLPCPQGPSPRRPLSFGAPNYVPNLHFNSPSLQQTRPLELYGPDLHFNPHGGGRAPMPHVHHGHLMPTASGETYSVCASMPIHGVSD